MHPYTNFEISTSKICTKFDADSRNSVRGQGQSDPKMGWDTSPSQDAFTHQIWDYYRIIKEECSGHDNSKKLGQGQGHRDPKMVSDTSPSKNAFTQRI